MFPGTYYRRRCAIPCSSPFRSSCSCSSSSGTAARKLQDITDDAHRRHPAACFRGPPDSARLVGEHLDGNGVDPHAWGVRGVLGGCWGMRRSTAISRRGTCPPPSGTRWAVAILGVDLLFYTYHRTAHRVRLIWATHQAHHSSQYYNFADSPSVTVVVEQQRRREPDVDPVAAVGHSAVDGVREFLDQPGLPVLDRHRTYRPSSGGQSNSSSTPRRTIGCTMAWTRNIWTGITLGS